MGGRTAAGDWLAISLAAGIRTALDREVKARHVIVVRNGELGAVWGAADQKGLACQKRDLSPCEWSRFYLQHHRHRKRPPTRPGSAGRILPAIAAPRLPKLLIALLSSLFARCRAHVSRSVKAEPGLQDTL